MANITERDIPNIGIVKFKPHLTIGELIAAEKAAEMAESTNKARVFTNSILTCLIKEPQITSQDIDCFSTNSLISIIKTVIEIIELQDEFEVVPETLPIHERFYRAMVAQQQEIAKEISDSIPNTIGEQLRACASLVNSIDFSFKISDIYSSFQLDITEWTRALDISSDIFDSIKTHPLWDENLSKQVQSITEDLSLIGKRIAADFAAMNFSAFNFPALGIYDGLKEILDYHQDSAEAFKTAGWTIAPSMDRKLLEKVVFFHQKGKTRYVSQVIMGYYFKNNFEKLKTAVSQWETNLLYISRMHIFNAALKAHCEGNIE